MRFRCPYCGELSFSAAHKAGFLARRYSRYRFARYGDYCPSCNANTVKNSNRIGKLRIAYYVAEVLYIVLLFFAASKSILGLFAGMTALLLLPFYIASSYFLTHYDLYANDRLERDNILIKFDDTLPFRKNTNEYVCEIKIDNYSTREKTYIIFDDKFKVKDKTLKFCMVAGRTPYLNDKVKVITNKGTYPGEVVEIIPKVATTPDVMPEFPDATKKPKRLKNWQNPDYFN